MASVILGQEQSDVLQGAQIILLQQFETWPGSGQAAGASGVTIGIAASAAPGGGAGTPVPTTSAGVAGGPADYQYTWSVPMTQQTGDYVVTWTGTVAGQIVDYQYTVTVAAMATGSPAPGTYASVDQYRAWSGDEITPAQLVAVTLRRASEDIDNAIIGAVYAVNANGMPTDAMVIDAFMRAACAQCQWLIAENDITGAKKQFTSVSIGGVTSNRAPGALMPPMPLLAPRAAQILHVAGVLGSAALINWS